MTKRTVLVSLLGLAAAACGGGDGGGNAAASKQFTYGPAEGATALEAGALQGSLTSMASLQGAPDVSSAASFTEFSDVTAALLGDAQLDVATESVEVLAQRKALTRAKKAALSSPTEYGTDFDNPSCVTVTSTSVTLSGCSLTVTESTTTQTATVTVTANGTVTLSNGNQTLTWDLTLALNMSASGSGVSLSAGGRFHAAGDLTVTAPTEAAEGTIKGSMTTETSLNASNGSQAVAIGVDESLDIDITYVTAPITCVTGGTLEAKRVITQWSVPNPDLNPRPSDRGAKVTFTDGGCNEGTIQFSL